MEYEAPDGLVRWNALKRSGMSLSRSQFGHKFGPTRPSHPTAGNSVRRGVSIAPHGLPHDVSGRPANAYARHAIQPPPAAAPNPMSPSMARTPTPPPWCKAHGLGMRDRSALHESSLTPRRRGRAEPPNRADF